MNAKERIVVQLPLSELWDAAGAIRAVRRRLLAREEVQQLIRTERVSFVVAEPGKPLLWISPAERYVFWKSEVRPHLVERPDHPFDIFEYPEGYAYLASEWWRADPAFPPIVVLERHH